MISIEADPEGKVVAVCADLKHHFSKSPRSSITLIAGCGIKGDAHFGSFVKHRYLARRKPRAPNMRQVHLIPTELLHGLQGAGYNVKPGDLGENITTAGLNLERTSVGNRTPDRERDYPTDGAADALRVDRPFQWGAEGRLVAVGPVPSFRAGLMAGVTDRGRVVPGDDVGVTLPATPRRVLPPT